MEQDRRFVELARGCVTGSGTRDDLATVAEGSRTLRTALQLTRLAGEAISIEANPAQQRRPT
jgi:hypothetical protein